MSPRERGAWILSLSHLCGFVTSSFHRGSIQTPPPPPTPPRVKSILSVLAATGAQRTLDHVFWDPTEFMSPAEEEQGHSFERYSVSTYYAPGPGLSAWESDVGEPGKVPVVHSAWVRRPLTR